ncbi:MAG: hypothetical protein RR829_00380 [Oscillospiraceae bacterium]
MKLAHRGITSAEPMVQLPMTAAVGYKVGQGLVITNGAAALVGASAAPTHICVCEAAGAAGGFVSAIELQRDMIFEAELSAAGTALTLGSKVTNDADSRRVTATTASGVAEIVGFPDGTKGIGDHVFIKY